MMAKSADDIRVELLGLGERMGALLDFVDGHRAELERRGYSPTVAETMAAALYAQLISHMGRK